MTDTLGEAFHLTRRFSAPRPLVFAALTEAKHLSHWMSPAGMELGSCMVDLRVGGSFHYGMRVAGQPAAPMMWGKWTFREITPPERLVVVVQFSDAHGGATRHPMAPLWPLYTHSTTTLVDEGNGITTLQLAWCPLNATAEEASLFAASHAGMAQGWGGTMDQLDAHLARVQQGG